MNRLYLDENLKWLSDRKEFPDASVDLVYLATDADADRYTWKLWHEKGHPCIQILTVEGLLAGNERVDAPPQINPFAMAAREWIREKQAEML